MNELWTPSRRLLLAGGAASLAAPRAWADTANHARAVAVEPSGRGAVVRIATARPAEANAFFLAAPDRFVIDLPGASWALGGRPYGEGIGAAVVRRYRYAPRPEGAARLVLDLEGPATLSREERRGGAQPELRFHLNPAQEASAAFARAPERPSAPIEGVRRVRPGALGRRRIVVVDAGHGGRDPGAVGVTGVREKDVVLDAALLLRDRLESTGRYEVHLTRDGDVFLPLPERVRLARAHAADLFISLHADANANAEARGASVYTLSERGAARAQGMMDAQNWQIDTGPARSGPVTDILVDLTQRETSNRSSIFAQAAIDRLGQAGPLLANTHRRASYFVLLAPDVPAVLIEMGFLTNPIDERRLATQSERHRAAEALSGAIDHYFASQGRYFASA